MSNKLSQKTEILRALVQGEELTPLDILNRFGCLRAAARIMDLRAVGYRIDNIAKDRNTRHAVYKLAKAPQGSLF